MQMRSSKYGKTVLLLMLVCTLLVCRSHAQAAPPPAPATTSAVVVSGDYAGTMAGLHLILHVQRDTTGNLTGTLDSVDQGANGIPCIHLALSGTQFSFDVPAVHGSYTGTASADGKTLTGTWSQGSPMPLVLTKSTATASATATAPVFVPASKPSPIDGDWTGDIATPMGPLTVLLHIKSDQAGKEFLTSDSPKQHAFGIPGENATLKGNKFSYDISVIHGHYDGTLSADGKSITGTWNQGSPMPLNFTRVEPFVPAAKPSVADGTWKGVLATQAGALHAVLHVKSDQHGMEYVSFDSPDQQAQDIDCTNPVLKGKDFSFDVPSIHGSYAGAVSADGKTLNGTWTQTPTGMNASSLPLSFSKSAAASKAATTAPPVAAGPLPLAKLPAELDAELKPLIENPELAGSSGIGVAIGVFENGKQRVLTYGTAKQNSLFEIGSITKTFTGLILSEMVVEKKLTLDTPVRELLPPGTVAKPAGPEITMLALATHHSGLPRMPDNFHPADPTNPYADYTQKNLYDYIAKQGVAQKPDAKFDYSNLGMALAGNALANKAGEPYNTLLQQDVLDPLHMQHTFIVIPAAEQKNFLPGHDGSDIPVHAWDLNSMAPAGGIRSDVLDMLTYMKAQLHPPAGLLAQAVALQHEPRAEAGPGKIAINWFLDPKTEDYFHNGGTGGFTSYAFFNTKHDLAGIVLVNKQSGFSDSLGARIAALLEGTPAFPIQP